MKSTYWSLLRGISLFLVITGYLVAQTDSVPEITFDSNPNVFKMPADLYLGEAAGVSTNSKGHVFVYTRTGNPTASLADSRIFSHGGSRLFEFDQNGAFVHEIGQGIYGFLQAPLRLR